MDGISDVILFVSSASMNCRASLEMINTTKLPIRVVRLDSEASQKLAATGNHAFSIKVVPTLLVVYQDGNIQQFVSHEKCVGWMRNFYERLLQMNSQPPPQQQQHHSALHADPYARPPPVGNMYGTSQPQPRTSPFTKSFGPGAYEDEPTENMSYTPPPQYSQTSQSSQRRQPQQQQEEYIVDDDDYPPESAPPAKKAPAKKSAPKKKTQPRKKKGGKPSKEIEILFDEDDEYPDRPPINSLGSLDMNSARTNKKSQNSTQALAKQMMEQRKALDERRGVGDYPV